MSLTGVALIVLALIALVVMRERPGASKLTTPFLISMMAAAISGLFAVGVVMVVAGFARYQ